MNLTGESIRPKQSKYRNKKTVYNGILFDSRKEANYAAILDQCRRASRIEDRVLSYEMQIPFQIEINGKKICKYIADFRVKYGDGSEKIIDVKGFRTAIYSLKKKLVEAQYGIKIEEI